MKFSQASENEDVSAPDTLCEICSGITISGMKSRRGYFHHPSVASLRQSADTCQTCQLFWRILGIRDDDELLQNPYRKREPQSPIMVNRRPLEMSDEETSWPTQVVLVARTGCKSTRPLHGPENSDHERDNSKLKCMVIKVVNSCICDGIYSPDLDNCRGCNNKPVLKVNCGIYTSEGSCSGIITKVQIPLGAVDQGVVDIAREWIWTCQTKHPNCEREATGLFRDITPRRIVDVRNGTVKVSTYDKQSPYLTLSHRWGKDPQGSWVSNSSNINGREFDVEDELPSTIQDAIGITRLLGYDFIWIDSLCIVQDDPDDWATEAGRMSGIYANSTLTISADAAADDSESFLCVRAACSEAFRSFPARKKKDSQERISIHIRYTNRMQDVGPFDGGIFGSDILDSPLRTRGWILQERILSPRILHFGKHLLFWECRTSCLAEDEHTFPYERRETSVPFLHLLQNSAEKRIDAYNAWAYLVKEYSCKELSRSDDKLPALSGLAQVIASRTGDQYLAGLWRQNLHLDLHWERKDSYQMAELTSLWRAPSWSWASHDYSVVHFLTHDGLTASSSQSLDMPDPSFELTYVDIIPESPFTNLVG